MISCDRQALECDLAETYHLFDLTGVPARKLASLATGLRDNSRIKLKLSGSKVDMNTLLLAVIADKLSWMVWLQSRDGQKNRNRPKSIVSQIMGETQKKDLIMSFNSEDEFNQKLKEIRGEN